MEYYFSDHELDTNTTYMQQLQCLDNWHLQSIMQINEQYWSQYQALQRLRTHPTRLEAESSIPTTARASIAQAPVWQPNGSVNNSVAKWLAMLESYATNVLEGFCVQWDEDITQHVNAALVSLQAKRFHEAYDAVRSSLKMLAEGLKPNGRWLHDVWSTTLQSACRWLSECIAIRTCHGFGRKIDKATLCVLMHRVFGRSCDGDHDLTSALALSYATVCAMASYHPDSDEFEEKARKVFFGPLSKDVLHIMHEAYAICARDSPYESGQDRKGRARPGHKKKRSERLAEGCVADPSTAASSGSTQTPMQQLPVIIEITNTDDDIDDDIDARGRDQHVPYDPEQPAQLQRCEMRGVMECNVQKYSKQGHEYHDQILCTKCLTGISKSPTIFCEA